MSDHPSVLLDIVVSAKTSFAVNKNWADKAVAQLPDEKLHLALDENTNSIAVIMKHVGGNLKSRWTDFLTTDGEKDWRDRDDEFVDTFRDRQELIEHWEAGWEALFGTLDGLQYSDLSRTITIRGESHSVPLAIHRSLAHCGYHVGQIIMIARILAKDEWDTITIAPGKSNDFNRSVWGKGHYNPFKVAEDECPNVVCSTDGKGNWWRREWKPQCNERVFLLDRCQGVLGHDGDHWCFRRDGAFGWSRDKDHPEYEQAASGITPPDHDSYCSPSDMSEHHYMNHFTDSEITDPEEIARLERNEVVDGESINRPCTAEEIKELGLEDWLTDRNA